jgi:hypothetical protein
MSRGSHSLCIPLPEPSGYIIADTVESLAASSINAVLFMRLGKHATLVNRA